jgi:histidyl-tRNA synthetase
MKMLQPVRGTQDFWFEKSRGFAEITDAVRALSELYGYEEVHTPIFEFSNVFSRTLGETSE